MKLSASPSRRLKRRSEKATLKSPRYGGRKLRNRFKRWDESCQVGQIVWKLAVWWSHSNDGFVVFPPAWKLATCGFCWFEWSFSSRRVGSIVKIFTTNLLALSLSNSPSPSAQLCHPDLNPSDESLHKKFLAVQEAYDVLSCDVKKREYDFDNVPSRPRPTVWRMTWSLHMNGVLAP